MKKYILILMLILIPVFSFAQEDKGKKDSEDVKISINVSKINRTLGNVVKFIKDEAKQYKQEYEENMPEEGKENIRKVKEDIKYELKYAHDAIHAGWCQGLRGEEYRPPYKHK